jgi:menaquinone-specific isochorismate synthase
VAVCGDRGIYFASGSVTLAGSGQAALLPLPRGLDDPAGPIDLGRQIAAIERDDAVGLPGSGPVAFGALGFEAANPARMVVPSLLYGRSQDAEWVTVVGEPPLEVPSREQLAARSANVGRIEPRLSPAAVSCEPADYAAAVATATGAIAAGRLRKVVLARRLVLEAGGHFVPSAVLGRLAAEEPSATAFLFANRAGAFVGASPELLVSRRGGLVVSHPLAGTTASGAGPGRRLLASAKDLEEHELVVADIARILDAHCRELEVPGEPSLVALHSLNHLGSRIQGRLLEEHGRMPSALELVGALHPTPAVGGVPLEPALELIAALEPGRRGCWAGPVGWMDAQGDGDWVVGLRSCVLSGSDAVVWAGAGIVAASDPDAELTETDLKLAVVLEALTPSAATRVESRQLRS